MGNIDCWHLLPCPNGRRGTTLMAAIFAVWHHRCCHRNHNQPIIATNITKDTDDNEQDEEEDGGNDGDQVN